MNYYIHDWTPPWFSNSNHTGVLSTMIYVHACIYQNFRIMKLFTFLSLPGANNAVIYIVVEFDKELGVNGSTMEVMPDNWRDHEGNLCVLYPYY